MKTNKAQGFTLVEILLLMVILSSFIYMGTGYLQQRTLRLRVDKTAAQMQQILNAGMSYYVNMGMWPCAVAGTCDLTTLQTGEYLPAGTIVSPWGSNAYSTSVPLATKALFSVSLTLPLMSNQVAIAAVIAGKLPLAKVTTCVAGVAGCTITAYVNVPGQNLSNATATNFSGLYHHGGCVPVPTCPVDKTTGVAMVPQVFVVPVSVSGVNDNGSNNVYPITSFTAYATGTPPGTGTSPPLCGTAIDMTSADCTSTTAGGGAPAGPYKSGDDAAYYWRACLQVITSLGNVATTRTDSVAWGQQVTVAAFTRCAVTAGPVIPPSTIGQPPAEPSGSTFSVFGN